jgi:hypothetical protein
MSLFLQKNLMSMEEFSDLKDRQAYSLPKREALACAASFPNPLLQAQSQAETKQVSWELYPG